MEPVEIQGEVFSEYFLRTLMWQDKKLTSLLDEAGARSRYRRTSPNCALVTAQPGGADGGAIYVWSATGAVPELLDWRLGKEQSVTTGEGDERAGYPVLGSDGRACASVLALAPDVSMDVAPPGRHRRFAPVLSLVRVLEEQGLNHGFLLNGYRLRLVRRAEGFVASFVDFDLGHRLEGAKLALRRGVPSGRCSDSGPGSRLRLCSTRSWLWGGTTPRASVGLGQQVQQAVVALIRGLLSHPANQDKVQNPPSRCPTRSAL